MQLTQPPFEQARLLVVGDVMLDRYWHGTTSRISPEAPVPVFKVGREEARKLGEHLIVAVNSDASIRRLKGESRPINPLDRRMAVLAGLESVDWVVGFDDDTPERLLLAFKPDVLVKGGDYREDEVVGWPIIRAYGGEVRTLRFFDSCSTTGIVNKIRGEG